MDALNNLFAAAKINNKWRTAPRYIWVDHCSKNYGDVNIQAL